MLNVWETGEVRTRPFVRGLSERDHLEDLAVDGRTK
jgi:hypothetical protein